MRVRTAFGVVVLGSLVLSSAAFAEEPGNPKDSKEPTMPAAESAGKTAPRMIVVQDPETGQLRAATTKEIEALKAVAPAPKLAVTGEPTSVEKLLSGRVRAKLGPEYMRYSVVRKNPDGSLSSVCVPASKVDEVVKAPVPAAKPAAEER